MDATPDRRIHWLDGVRGAAALFVVLHHMWLASWPHYPDNEGPWWLGFLLYGHLAVAVFIVVSGYSLALAPLRRGGVLSGGMRRFVRRRAWRILPAYWAALIFSTILWLAVLSPSTGGAEATKAFAVHATLLQDVIGSLTPNGAFWSIAVEWQIYFVFPLILLVALRSTMVRAVALTTVVVLIGHAVASTGVSVLEKINHLTPQFLALFAFGVLAAWAAHRGIGPAVRRALIAATVAAFAGFVVLALAQGSPWVTEHWFWVDLLFGTGVAGALFLTATSQRSWREATLGCRSAVLLGAFSYSLYLMHAPLLQSMQKLVLDPLELSAGANFAAQLVIVLPVVLGLCYAFHRVFERPFLERRDLASLKTLPIFTRVSRPRKALAAPQFGDEPAR
jgi:peptidoglycan/LPS O-acetylase OafA/YrhL